MFRLIFLLCLFVFALACGGGGTVTNNGVQTVVLRGQLVESPANPLAKYNNGTNVSTVYTALAYNLNNVNETWDVTVLNDLTFQVEITRKVDVKIDFKRIDSGVVAFSRILFADETIGGRSNTRVNVVTHFLAALAEKNQASYGSWEQNMLSHRLELLGTSNVTETGYTIGNVLSNYNRVRAYMATYQQLFGLSTDASFSSLMNKLSEGMKVPLISLAGTSYINVINTLGVQEATLMASAHEGAKNSSGLAPQAFLDVASSVSSTIVSAAFFEALKAPVFGGNVDSVRTAAPGVLFSYQFPEAKTEDVLGLKDYVGAWSGETPKGLLRTDANQGRSIYFVPDQEDLGQTYVYELEARGLNGKNAKSGNIEIKVGNVQIQAKDRKALQHVPLFGPVVSGNSVFWLSQNKLNSQKYLERAGIDVILNSGDGTLVNSSVLALPSKLTDVWDMAIYSDNVYVAGNAEGIVVFNANFTDFVGRNSVYSNNLMNVFDLEIVGESVFAWGGGGNIQRLNLTLGSNVYEPNLVRTLGTTVEPQISSLENKYLVVSGNQVNGRHLNHVFTVDAFSGNLIQSSFSPDSEYPSQNSEVLEPNLLLYAGGGNVQLNQLSNTEVSLGDVVSTTNLTVSTPDIYVPLMSQGRHAFAFVAGNVSSSSNVSGNIVITVTDRVALEMKALSGNVEVKVEEQFSAAVASGNYSLYFDALKRGQGIDIYNPEKGLLDSSTQSGAYIFSIGQSTTTAPTDNWFIRHHRVEALAP
jgi:hypothetical protein